MSFPFNSGACESFRVWHLKICLHNAMEWVCLQPTSNLNGLVSSLNANIIHTAQAAICSLVMFCDYLHVPNKYANLRLGTKMFCEGKNKKTKSLSKIWSALLAIIGSQKRHDKGTCLSLIYRINKNRKVLNEHVQIYFLIQLVRPISRYYPGLELRRLRFYSWPCHLPAELPLLKKKMLGKWNPQPSVIAHPVFKCPKPGHPKIIRFLKVP